ncbi:MAG: non-ribosomal peptide synthase protein (TIGR01720 family), partial [Verrucomicrobiales bacterium]
DVPQAEEVQQFLRTKLPGYMVPSSVVVLDELARLPNGKIDTRALQAMGRMEPENKEIPTGTGTSGSGSDLEQTLAKIWMEVLGTDDLRIDDNFFEIGGDSIMSIRIVALCREAGIAVTPGDLMANQTITELAAVASWDGKNAGLTSQTDTEVSGEVSLTPIQHWFFELELAVPEHWNQAMLVDIPSSTNAEILEEAIAAVFAHHDLLRARFHRTDDGWMQVIPPASDALGLSLAVYQVSADAVAEKIGQLHREIRFGEDAPPLARFALFCDDSGQAHTLAVIMHHLIVDNISWKILLDDLSAAYEQIADGSSVALPAKATSYQQWAEHLVANGNSAALRDEMEYWTAPVPADLATMPVDFSSDSPLVESDSKIVRLTFSKEQTDQLLKGANTAYNTRAHDLLIVALTKTLLGWAGGSALRLGLEGFGRDSLDDSIDVSRSVGWFTAFYSVTLQLDAAAANADEVAIKAIKEQLRNVPDSGVGYGLLRYLSTDSSASERIRSLPREQVLFNYLGTLPAVDSKNHGLIQSVRAVSENARSGKNHRSHLLEINAYIDGGALELLWTYNTRAHSTETIEKLGTAFFEILSNVISHCLATGSGGYTPSDFPDADLDQDDLDRFLDSIG